MQILSRLAASLFLCVWFSVSVCGQTAEPATNQSIDNAAVAPVTGARLTVVSTVDLPSEIAQEFGPPLRCDHEGNLYLHGVKFAMSGFRKFSPKGERIATFDPNPDSKVKPTLFVTFALREGELYALVFTQDATRYLFVYGPDGIYKSTIKLDPGFRSIWTPRALGVFKSGEMLIAGTRTVRTADKQFTEVPFTGLFRADGTLLKTITLDDDSQLHEQGEAGDNRYTTPGMSGANRAIDFSQTDAGEDGNIYLMRWTSPAIIYVVSPSGELVRRFTVDPGDSFATPMTMHVSGKRLAVLFMHPERTETVIKVVDFEGNEIFSFKSSLKDTGWFGGAFGCYVADKDRFTFLSTTTNQRLRFTFAEPR